MFEHQHQHQQHHQQHLVDGQLDQDHHPHHQHQDQDHQHHLVDGQGTEGIQKHTGTCVLYTPGTCCPCH